MSQAEVSVFLNAQGALRAIRNSQGFLTRESRKDALKELEKFVKNNRDEPIKIYQEFERMRGVIEQGGFGPRGKAGSKFYTVIDTFLENNRAAYEELRAAPKEDDLQERLWQRQEEAKSKADQSYKGMLQGMGGRKRQAEFSPPKKLSLAELAIGQQHHKPVKRRKLEDVGSSSRVKRDNKEQITDKDQAPTFRQKR